MVRTVLTADKQTLSFQVPLNAAFAFITNSTYSQSQRQFVPVTELFESTVPKFQVPHWWLNVNTRLHFFILDKTIHRLVDYVNLSAWEVTMDVTDMLMRDNPQTPNDGGPSYIPSGGDGGMWYTNRIRVANPGLAGGHESDNLWGCQDFLA